MTLKVCNESGCPELTEQPKCLVHRTQAERQRGTRQARGYDLAYDHSRQRVAIQVAAGKVTCWSCDLRISPLEAWHQGHCEDDRTMVHGPEHPACNLGHIGHSCPHASHVKPDM